VIDLEHPLGQALAGAVAGCWPPKDGLVETTPPAHPCALGVEVITEFTAHAVVSTALSDAEVQAQGPDGYGGAARPDFVRWLAGTGRVGAHDVLLVRRGTGRGGLAERPDLAQHPRSRHARTLRTDVRVYGDERGLVTTGQGVAGRWEVSVELVAGVPHGQGYGRGLIEAAVGLVPDGEPAFAQVSPGNAASLRAFLACGFTPLGAEIALWPQRTGSPR
jgi:hypothetical protein